MQSKPSVQAATNDFQRKAFAGSGSGLTAHVAKLVTKRMKSATTRTQDESVMR